MAPPPVRQYPPDACNTLYIEGLPGRFVAFQLSHAQMLPISECLTLHVL